MKRDKSPASSVKAQAKQRLPLANLAQLALVHMDLTRMSIVMARVNFVKAARQDPLKVNVRRRALVPIAPEDFTKIPSKLASTISTIVESDGMNRVLLVRRVQ